MNNFVFNAYTEIYFGEGQVAKLPEILSRYGKKVLLVYGGGSVKKNGIYDAVVDRLAEFEIFEVSGIKPNPRIDDVRRGVEIAKKENVDVVLAVGGGSTIDSAKMMAGGYYYDNDPWDLVLKPELIGKVLPIVTVLTLAATGSEMNKNAVISNMETNEKLGTASKNFIPKASICDPSYTYGVPAYQTAAGTADIISHVCENYFKKEKEAFVQDRFSEGIIKACVKYAPIAIAEPNNYEARANLMWASTMALNGLCGAGKAGAWTCHPIEHELSAFYDITHGVGLAIVTPRWMRYILSENTVDKFVDFAKNVWGLDGDDSFELANKGIDALEDFFRSLNIPMSLAEVGIGEDKLELIAEKAVVNGGLSSSYVALSEDDVLAILKMCL